MPPWFCRSQLWTFPERTADRAVYPLPVSVGLMRLPSRRQRRARTEAWAWARCADPDFGDNRRSAKCSFHPLPDFKNRAEVLVWLDLVLSKIDPGMSVTEAKILRTCCDILTSVFKNGGTEMTNFPLAKPRSVQDIRTIRCLGAGMPTHHEDA
jgi:hypothetical protein